MNPYDYIPYSLATVALLIKIICDLRRRPDEAARHESPLPAGRSLIMLYHTAICVSDVERAARFYDGVLGTLGYRRFYDFSPEAVCFGIDRGEFWIQSPAHQRSSGPSRGAHFAFAACDRATVEHFYAVALGAGGAGESPPAAHPELHPDYYGAVVVDLDGHKVEVLLHRT